MAAFTGQIYRGGHWVNMHRDLDSIPVLAGEGTIVPMFRSGENNDLSLAQPLDIHIWRGSGQYELYEDDGETNRNNHLITRMEVTEQGSTLKFVIHPGEGDLTLVPRQRDMTLIFRDVEHALVHIDGQPAQFHKDGIRLMLDTTKGVTVTLTQVIPAGNRPKHELRTELLTRVQGEIIWKNAVFSKEKRMPTYLRDALEELDFLDY